MTFEEINSFMIASFQFPSVWLGAKATRDNWSNPKALIYVAYVLTLDGNLHLTKVKEYLKKDYTESESYTWTDEDKGAADWRLIRGELLC